MTAADVYPDWDNYETHADALVWRQPVCTRGDRSLRHVVGFLRSSHAAADPVDVYGWAAGERSAYRRTLAYLSGLTETRWTR